MLTVQHATHADAAGGAGRLVPVGNGLDLHVATDGRGPPALLLHGFTGSGRSWQPLRTALGARYATIAVDLPGHGRSSAPADPSRYALDRTADDLARVLDACRVDRAAILGYSLGGRAAMRVALRHPDRVAALVLESASPGIADAVERAQRAAADAALADAILQHGVLAFVERWERLPLWTSQEALPEAARAGLRRDRLANDAHGLANSLLGAGAGADGPVLDALAFIGVPALLIAGALDAKYVALADAMQRAMPSAQLAVVPDAGHAVHLERADAFAALVRGFLDLLPRVDRRWA